VRLVRDGGVIWGLGMYASGSTWAFNAMLKIAEALAPDLPRASRFVASEPDVGDLAPGRILLCVKSHETDPPSEARLAQAAGLIVISIRDPLDVVASGLEYQHCDFPKALDLAIRSARQCARHMADPRAQKFRYESGFVDDPATLDKLAERMGGVLPLAERSRIFAATRRREVERYIAGLPQRPGVLIHRPTGDMLDPATHWHTHHSGRTGEVGRWKRTLTAGQVREIEDNLGDWMAANLYPVGRAA
jgi:pyruvoyl-dependent arginine decarboxylase (PvlArgDC)